MVRIALNEQRNRMLREFCDSRRVELPEFFIACISILLTRWTGDSNCQLEIRDVRFSAPELPLSRTAQARNTIFVAKIELAETFYEILQTVVGEYRDDPDLDGQIKNGVITESESTRDLFPRLRVVLTEYERSQGLMPAPPLVDNDSSYLDVEESTFELYLNLGNDLEFSSSYRHGGSQSTWTEEFLEQLTLLVPIVLEMPNTAVAEHSLLTPRSRLLIPGLDQPVHGTTNAFPSVSSRIADQIYTNPDRTLLQQENITLSYAAFGRFSEQISRWLINTYPNDELIGVYAERNLYLIIALFSIWRSNKTFVVVDSDQPPKRLKEQIDRVRPAVVLNCTQDQRLLDKLFDIVPIEKQVQMRHLITMDEISHTAAASSALTSTRRAGNAGYISFTSGSTGQPKAVRGRALPVSHFVEWYLKTFSVTYRDRFSMLSGIAHDPLLRDIFISLSVGGTICIPVRQYISFELGNWLVEQQVTVIHLTPTLFRTLAEFDKTLPNLRYIFFGGEVLTQRDLTLCKTLAPNAIVVNFYGATETPQAAAYYEVAEDWSTNPGLGTIPIGKGIDGVQLVLLRGNTQCGLGEVAEICVRSAYLTEGYLNKIDDDRNYIVNPVSKLDHDRMYRTGDLGRYDLDGNVFWIGRSDGQLKIRGFRVEPTAIVSTLTRHENVSEAAVVPFQDVEGTTTIKAYVVPRGSSFDMDSISNYIKTSLPSYMWPAAIQLVESLPRNSNGKLDTKPLLQERSMEGGRSKQISPLESTLVAIFREVLQREYVDIDEDIFDLGCHSLLLLKVSNRIRAKLCLEVPIAAFFEYPTVRRLGGQLQSWLANEEPEE